MNQRMKDNRVLQTILLAITISALSLPGLVYAQGNPSSSGQQAVRRFLDTSPGGVECVAGGPGAARGDIARATGAPPPACGTGAYGATQLEQLSAQSAIQVNTTVVASPAETARTVRCLAAGENGVVEPGCEDVLSGAVRTYAAPGRQIAGPLGLSIVARGDKGRQDPVSGQTGFDASAAMLTASLDYRFSDKVVGGVSFGYQHTKLDFDLDSGSLKNDAYRLSMFLSYAITPEVLVDGLIGIGLLDYDSKRLCSPCFDATGTTPQTLSNTASYIGNQSFASIGVGKLLPIQAWMLRGYARGDYVQVKTGDYTETGTAISGSSATTALQVQGQRASSLTSLLGIEGSRAISTSWGVITPRARVEWLHEFKDDSRTITSQFVSAIQQNIATPMVLTTAEPERDWFNFGLGAQMNLARSLAAFVDYQYTLRSDARNSALSLGIRYNF